MAVARVTEIISASDQNFEHAVREGIVRANQTLEKWHRSARATSCGAPRWSGCAAVAVETSSCG